MSLPASLDHSLHAAAGDKQDKVQQQRRNSLRRIARWVTGLLGHADLTPSDTAIALVLTATLQRQCRRRALLHGLRSVQLAHVLTACMLCLTCEQNIIEY